MTLNKLSTFAFLASTSVAFAATDHSYGVDLLASDFEVSDLYSTWSGPGPYACHGQCDMEWAMNQLTEEERAELAEVMKNQPEPGHVAFYDGDVFTMMSYYRDGQAYATRHPTVARLDAPEASTGWVVGDWAFVKINACQNWAVLRRPIVSQEPIQETLFHETFTSSLVGMTSYNFGGESFSISSNDDEYTIINTDCDCEPETPTTPDIPDTPDVAPIPLPASVMFLLAGLGFLGLLRFRSE